MWEMEGVYILVGGPRGLLGLEPSSVGEGVYIGPGVPRMRTLQCRWAPGVPKIKNPPVWRGVCTLCILIPRPKGSKGENPPVWWRVG